MAIETSIDGMPLSNSARFTLSMFDEMESRSLDLSPQPALRVKPLDSSRLNCNIDEIEAPCEEEEEQLSDHVAEVIYAHRSNE